MKKVTDLGEKVGIICTNRKESKAMVKLMCGAGMYEFSSFNEESGIEYLYTFTWDVLRRANNDITYYLASDFLEPEYTITKEQIESIANGSDIKTMFPEVFEPVLEVGKWYTDNDDYGFLVYITKIKQEKYFGYGFDGNGDWCNDDNEDWGDVSDIDKPATYKEVRTAIEKEAVKRYPIGAKVKCLLDGRVFNIIRESVFDFDILGNKGYFGGVKVFDNGKWAEIIEEEVLDGKEVVIDGRTYKLRLI